LIGIDLEILIVAKWWKVDPDIVENWSFIDFLNRQEFMFVQMEMRNNIG